MSNNVPAPVNQADPALAERAAEIRAFGRGDNRLPFIARKLRAGHDRCVKGSQDWVEGSLEVAAALREGRDAVPADISFNGWLKANNLNFYNKDDRAALIELAADLGEFRQVLGETDSRSYRLIWKEFRGRFRNAAKPTRAGRPRKPRMMGVADIHRRNKLGDKTVDDPKGTSLRTAREQDGLVKLNRGAAKGEHTAIVKQLVADAVAGKNVSAVTAWLNYGALPLGDDDDNSADEAERLRVRNEELEGENRQLRARNKELEAENRQLKFEKARLPATDHGDGGDGLAIPDFLDRTRARP